MLREDNIDLYSPVNEVHNLEFISENLKSGDDIVMAEALVSLRDNYPGDVPSHKRDIADAIISGGEDTLTAGLSILDEVKRYVGEYACAPDILTKCLGSSEIFEAGYDQLLLFTINQMLESFYSDAPSRHSLNYRQVLVDSLPEIIDRADNHNVDSPNVSAAAIACLDIMPGNTAVTQAEIATYLARNSADMLNSIYDLATEPTVKPDFRDKLYSISQKEIDSDHLVIASNQGDDRKLYNFLMDLGADEDRDISDLVRLAKSLASCGSSPYSELTSSLVAGICFRLEVGGYTPDTRQEVDSLVTAWKNSSARAPYHPSFEEAIEGNINTMIKLEKLRPGITGALMAEPFGITNFNRYPADLLIEQFDTRNLDLPYGVIYNPKGENCDWNGCFYQMSPVYASMIEQLQEINTPERQFLIRAYEGDGDYGYNRGLVLLSHEYENRPSFLFDNSHANQAEISRGSSDPSHRHLTKDKLAFQSDFRGQGVSSWGARRLFAPNPTLIMNACSTGDVGAIGIEEMRQVLGATVYAPESPCAVSSVKLELDSNDQVIASAMYEDNDGSRKKDVTAYKGSDPTIDDVIDAFKHADQKQAKKRPSKQSIVT